MIATFTTQTVSESISEDLKANWGGMPPDPQNGALSRAIQSPPQTFSMLRFAPPCDICVPGIAMLLCVSTVLYLL